MTPFDSHLLAQGRPADLRSFAQRGPSTRKAFTLLEMLIVIGIITLLTAILIPVVSQVRIRAAVASTQGQMARIQGACLAYYHDFNAYPGPLAEISVASAAPGHVDPNFGLDPGSPQQVTPFQTKVTSSENLYLGLIGLLNPVPGNPIPTYTPPPPKHDVMSINSAHPVSYHYMDFLVDEIPQPGGAGGDYFAIIPPTATSDSSIPEFMDHIPTPMPILYMRAVPGATSVTSINGVDPTDSTRRAAYNYSQLAPYGFTTVTTADFALPSGYTLPAGANADWTAYLMNPSIPGEPRGKNAFVLIDAGPDRIFGTKDDIIVTP